MKKFLSIGNYDDGKNVSDLRMTTVQYGYGLFHGEKVRNGKKYDLVYHPGGMPGTAAVFTKILNDNIWVVYLNNAGSYPDEFDVLDQAKIKY